VQVPEFPEAHHPLVKSLFGHSDRDLLTLFQRHLDEGKYFTAIFCRYAAVVYTLIAHSVPSPVQRDYLFALTWRHLFYELRSPDLQESLAAHGIEADPQRLTVQNWLIDITATCINQAQLPPPEDIHYSLKDASPPLWCYLQQALDALSPLQRTIAIMAQTFRWSETRIAAYLQAEGESLSPAKVGEQIPVAYRELEAALPQDIREIYLVSVTG